MGTVGADIISAFRNLTFFFLPPTSVTDSVIQGTCFMQPLFTHWTNNPDYSFTNK